MSNFDKLYLGALREVTEDALEIAPGKKVAPHLRVAVKSHAKSLAQSRLAHGSVSDLAKSVNPGPEPQISRDADEILMWVANDSDIYRQEQAVIANLIKKLRKGVYNHELAAKGFLFTTDLASQVYMKQIGNRENIDFANRGSGSHAFSAGARREAAKHLAWGFIRSAQIGEFDDR